MVFSKLDREHLARIVELQLSYLRERLEDKKITIKLNEEARAALLAEGYDEQFGARPLKRAIQRLIQDPLALALLEGDFGEGDHITVGYDGTKMTFAKAVAEPEAVPA